MIRTRDKGASTRSAFIRAQKAAVRYGVQLRKVARHVGDIVNAFSLDDHAAVSMIEQALQRYAGMIDGWAKATAKVMVTEVADRDRAAWMQVSREMGKALRKELETAPTGQIMRQRLDEQVGLIKSIPLEAAQRVRHLANEAQIKGQRASYVAEEIMRTGEVSKSKATLIARSEVSRTATDLTRARAEHVGSQGYLWRTSRDADVRHSHREMEGKFVAWDKPPTLDGMVGHAGQFPNCRCWPEPIIPDD